MYRLVPAFLALLVVGHGALAHDKEIEGGEAGGSEPQLQALCEAGEAAAFSCWNAFCSARRVDYALDAGHAERMLKACRSHATLSAKTRGSPT